MLEEAGLAVFGLRGARHLGQRPQDLLFGKIDILKSIEDRSLRVFSEGMGNPIKY